jgi:glycerophosphoryl diester phosphodiesterase
MRFIVTMSFFLPAFIAMSQAYTPKFDVQGHRGARGLMPENTIPAFLLALDSGVTTLEMDLAVTKDRQLVVSHEPWMNAAICSDPSGKSIAPKEETKHNIFQMTYEQVRQYDCGAIGNQRFPQQMKMSVHKPLLVDVIKEVEKHIRNKTNYEVDYNIEIKSDPKGDNKFHPAPPEFSELVFSLIDQYLPLDRVVIQSFDFRVLKYWHEKHPEVRLAALVENLHTIDENIKDLGFVPAIYSPEYRLLSKGEIRRVHELGMRVIPWTINDKKEMEELKSWGVDGLITDYPNLARELGYTLKSPKGKK